MEKETNNGDFETEQQNDSDHKQSRCSVSIVFSEGAEDDVLSSSMETLEKQYADKSIMR